MEITDFLSLGFLTTFTGTLVAVELVVFVTKDLPIIKKMPTRIYTFIQAISQLIIINTINGTLDITLEFFYVLIINAIAITVILCGGYDIAIGRIRVSDSTKEGKE